MRVTVFHKTSIYVINLVIHVYPVTFSRILLLYRSRRLRLLGSTNLALASEHLPLSIALFLGEARANFVSATTGTLFQFSCAARGRGPGLLLPSSVGSTVAACHIHSCSRGIS